MVQATRLFDCIPIQATHPKMDLLASKSNGIYKTYSTADVHQQIQELCTGLLAKGVSANDMTTEGRDKIGILSNSRPEWIITDLAVQQVGAILVPLYPNIASSEIVGIFNESQLKGCFVNTKDLYEQIKAIQPEVPSLQWIYCFDQHEGVPHWTALKTAASAVSIQQIKEISDKISTEDIATIIYTSGTTGKPKGVMLSHKNIVSNVLDVAPILEAIGLPEKRSLSFLPLNHIYEKMVSYVYLFNGFSIYYAENMDTIADNLKEAKPYIFVTVPRLLEKVYEKIMATGQQLKGIKRFLFFWALGLGTQFEPGTKKSWWYNVQLSVANKIIFNKWREALGGNVKAIVVGGAACQPRLVRIFSAAQVTIMEGYGLTETSPVIAVNEYPEVSRRVGTVGPILHTVQVKIADDGEILCKGNNVMVGYYKQPEATSEVLIDGWLATGDIGEIVEGRFLKITDRKKELFKTSGGKYVAPQPIENKFKESRFVEQIMIIGPGRKFVSALIVPSFPALKNWMKENGLDFIDNKQAIQEPKVLSMFHEIVEKYNPNFNHVEQVKKFALIPNEWSIEGGEMTPKLSMKRKFINTKYQNEIEQMYVD
jgi:long-chain acyl-CoA synthetase